MFIVIRKKTLGHNSHLRLERIGSIAWLRPRNTISRDFVSISKSQYVVRLEIELKNRCSLKAPTKKKEKRDSLRSGLKLFETRERH